VGMLRAHIFKLRSRGEREEVKIRLMNPDGSDVDLGGGGGSMLYRGWSQKTNLPSSDEQVQIPFGNSIINVVEGFEVDPGDMEIAAPKGAYQARIEANWNTTAPTTGFASVFLVHVDSDDNEVIICRLELNTAFESDGLGDGPLGSGASGNKFDFGVAKEDGHLELRVFQNTDDSHNLQVSTRLTLVKL